MGENRRVELVGGPMDGLTIGLAEEASKPTMRVCIPWIADSSVKWCEKDEPVPLPPCVNYDKLIYIIGANGKAIFEQRRPIPPSEGR